MYSQTLRDTTVFICSLFDRVVSTREELLSCGAVTQRVVVISCYRLETIYRLHLQGPKILDPLKMVPDRLSLNVDKELPLLAE